MIRTLLRRVMPLLATLLAVPTSPTAAQDADPPGIRLVRLALDIRVHYTDGSLDGVARMTVENAGAGPVHRIPLQVHRLMDLNGAEDGGGGPLPLEQDVVRYRDDRRRQVTQGWVTLPDPVPVEGTREIVVRWSGFLWGYTETGSRYIRDRVDSAFTILRDDALAFPTPRVASWRANRATPRRDFDFEVRVTVPHGQVVAAGGTLADRIGGDSLTTWVYRSTIPVPFLNITIAPYAVRTQDGVRIHYFPGDSLGARMVDSAIAGAVDRLTAWFGPLGRELNLSVMEIPEGFGSQANLGAGIIQDARAFRDRSSLGQLYHELTHLWNVPDLDRPSPRWNEGLATFLEHRLSEELDGWKGMDGYVERVVEWFLPRFVRDPTNAETPFIDYGRAGKTDLAYTVGFLMFYSLHELLGPDAFDRAIGGWYQERRTRGGTTDEFVAHVKRTSPVSLDGFFEDWFYSMRWYERLAAGTTVRALVDDYRE